MFVVLVLALVLGLPARGLGATYHVSKGGDDSTPCGAGARQSINAGIACMQGGDTLLVDDGVYDEIISDLGQPGTVPPPNGTSWSNVTTIRARNVYGATLRKRTGSHENRLIQLWSGTRQYLQIEGFVCDTELKAYGVFACLAADRTHHIRLKNMRVIGQIANTTDSTYLEFINVDGRDHGYDAHGNDTCYGGSEKAPGYCHAYYVQNQGPILIHGGTLDHFSGYCVQGYASQITIDGTTMSRCLVGAGILVGPGSTVKNTLVVKSGSGWDLRNGGHQILDNTFCDAVPSGFARYGIIDQGVPRSNTIQNNRFIQMPMNGSSDGLRNTTDQSLDTTKVTGNTCDIAAAGCQTVTLAAAVADLCRLPPTPPDPPPTEPPPGVTPPPAPTNLRLVSP